MHTHKAWATGRCRQICSCHRSSIDRQMHVQCEPAAAVFACRPARTKGKENGTHPASTPCQATTTHANAVRECCKRLMRMRLQAPLHPRVQEEKREDMHTARPTPHPTHALLAAHHVWHRGQAQAKPSALGCSPSRRPGLPTCLCPVRSHGAGCCSSCAPPGGDAWGAVCRGHLGL